MFVCTVCDQFSERREPEVVVMHEIREVEYRNGDRNNPKFSLGWEIVRQGRAAHSHGHFLFTRRLILSDGLETSPITFDKNLIVTYADGSVGIQS